MKAHLFRTDASYDVFFKRPLLDRLPSVPAPLQTVYDALSDNFSISTADVQVNQGTSVADTSIVYNLFTGAGSIELRPDRWRGAFRGLISEQDIQLVLRCVQTVAAAIEKTSDRMIASRSILTVATWHQCDITVDQVAALLSTYWMPGKELKIGFLDAEKIRIELNPVLENAKEGWVATFYVAPSKVDSSQLFMNYKGTYASGGRYNSIEVQATHARSMLRGMLNELGFETPSAA
jgi:hypothetical protein